MYACVFMSTRCVAKSESESQLCMLPEEKVAYVCMRIYEYAVCIHV